MFSNNSNLPQQNPDKIFTIEETQERKKRKSFSFCMNEETLKDATFFQNYFNNDIPMQQTAPEPKGNLTSDARIRSHASQLGWTEPEQWVDQQLLLQPHLRTR
jgi:hypothetical protein